MCTIYIHPGVPSFAVVVCSNGLVVDGPGWDWPNGAGDPGVPHVGQQIQEDWTVCYLENQLLECRPDVFRWQEGERHHLPHKLVHIVSLLIRHLKLFKDNNYLFKMLATFE